MLSLAQPYVGEELAQGRAAPSQVKNCAACQDAARQPVLAAELRIIKRTVIALVPREAPEHVRARRGPRFCVPIAPPAQGADGPGDSDERRGVSPPRPQGARLAQPCADPSPADQRSRRRDPPRHASLPVSQTGSVEGHKAVRECNANLLVCRQFGSGAAQEANLPTVGLPRPAGFEDETDSAPPQGFQPVCAPRCAPQAVMSCENQGA